MHEVVAEGVRYVYLTSPEEISSAAEKYAFRYVLTDPPSDRALELIGQAGNVRPVLIETVYVRFGQTHVLFFARWPVEKDLVELDARVAVGAASDDDFADSIMTSHLAPSCPNCRSRWHVLHVVSETYPHRSELLRQKVEKTRSRPCPNCATPMRLFVTDILGPAEPD